MTLKDIISSVPYGREAATFLLLSAGIGATNVATAQQIDNNHITGHQPPSATSTITGNPLYLHQDGADGEPGTVDDQPFPTAGSPLIGSADPSYGVNELGISGFDKDNATGAYGPAANIPVEGAEARAIYQNGKVGIEIRTIQETQNAGFRIYQFTKDGDEEQIGFVDGAGTTSEPQSYQFTDSDLSDNPNPAIYNIEQIDLDGTVNPLERVSVSYQEDAYLSVYPNPLRGGYEPTVEIGGLPQGSYDAQVVDILGRSVQRRSFEHDGGTRRLDLGLDGLASGPYFLRIQGEDGNTTLTEKVTVTQ